MEKRVFKKEREPIIHKLKTWPEYYEEVESGRKTFEIRKNNRDFREGDTIILQEFILKEKLFTGKELNFKIGYIFYGEAFGVKKGFCIMQLN